MPFVTSFEEIAKEEGIKLGEERGQRIGKIHAFEEILSLPLTPMDELHQKSLEELDLIVSELKTKLIR